MQSDKLDSLVLICLLHAHSRAESILFYVQMKPLALRQLPRNNKDSDSRACHMHVRIVRSHDG
jgi:hypothetical protein